MNDIYLTHSAKGQTWGHHRYIAIKNGRYIYPEDLQKQNKDRESSRNDYKRQQIEEISKRNSEFLDQAKRDRNDSSRQIPEELRIRNEKRREIYERKRKEARRQTVIENFEKANKKKRNIETLKQLGRNVVASILGLTGTAYTKRKK